jgi:hypothetical protein
MLKRQMDSVRHRTTSGVENDRIQQVLQQQLEKSRYQSGVVVGENGRYEIQIANGIKDLNRRTAVSHSDLARMEQVVRAHLAEVSTDLVLPETCKWNGEGNVESILQLIKRICAMTVSLRETKRVELGALEGQLSEEHNDLRNQIKRLERENSMKQQHLQALGTELSGEMLAMKDEKRRFLMAIRPKNVQLERLEGRRKLFCPDAQ